MKTKNPINLENKRSLLLLIVLLVGTMSVLADVDYGFWVGSVKVKKSNCNNITGGNIESGTVRFYPDTKVLEMTNVHINAKGSGGDVIHNNSCEGLKVYFYGTNTLYAHNDVAVWCEKQTQLIVKTGFTRINGLDANKRCVYLMGPYSYVIRSEIGAEFWIEAGGYGVQGYPQQNSTVYPDLVIGGDNIYINAKKGSLRNLNEVEFRNYNGICDVTMQSTGSSSYPIVSYVSSMPGVNYSSAYSGNPIIVSPFKAEFKSTSAGICNSSGNLIYADNIYVSNEYVVPINWRYFSDTAFCNYLMNRFGYVVLWQNTINNCTSMDVSSRSISSLQGISYFTELQTLDCSYNKLTNLSNVSLGKLTTLNCSNNSLTSLGYSCSRLQKLYCNNNKLTTITSNDIGNLKELYCYTNNLTTISLPNYSIGLTVLSCSNNKLTSLNYLSSQSTSLQTLYCENNAFTSLNLESFSKLSDFRCSNNPSLKTLVCRNNPSLTSLNVTNCASLNSVTYSNNSSLKWLSFSSVPALETITCTYNRQISGITLSCSNLKTLNVSNNSLSQIFDLSNCPKLNTFDCSYNQLTTLDVSDCTYLDVLDCSNNQLTSMELPYMVSNINCSSNKFTSLFWGSAGLSSFNCSSNPNLTSLYLPDNRYLNNLNISGCNALKIIDISGCSFSSIYMSNRTALEELNCDHQTDRRLTSLNVAGCTGLKKLSCSENQLSSLDLYTCNALTELKCSYNRLTSISLPNSCPSLQSITCDRNSISGSKMDALVAALPNRTNSSVAGSFKVFYTGTTFVEGNVCMATHVKNAKAKNWNTYQSPDGYNWTLYTGVIPTVIRTAEADVDDNAPRYNMNGQRVGRDYKGIVIVNGKKVNSK